MRPILKNPKILVWVFFIIISILAIAPNPSPGGFAVVSVNSSAIQNINHGEIIYSINNDAVSADSLARSYTGLIKISTNRGIKYISVNGSLGITAEPAPSSNIKLGLDLKGGVRGVIEPNVSNNATIEQIIATLEQRINFYGLRESVFRPVYYDNKGYVEISIAGGTRDELKELIESQGNFEAKIPFLLGVTNGKAALKTASIHELTVSESDIILDNGSTITPGGKFLMDDIEFLYGGYESGKINLTATVINGNDIITVFFDPQRSRIESTGTDFRWSFGVQLSSDGARKFSYVTSNINQMATGYLEAPIVFYLDSRFIDSLSIASTLKGKVETEISITGSAKTMQDAVKIKAQLQSILRSGALPTSVEIIQLDSISPTLGAGFLKSAALAAIAALIGVIILVSVRYRKPKLVVPMVFISITEILIVVGLASAIGWTIDLAAIAGLIASVGTGISDQIIILDRALRKEEEHYEALSQKIKNAFFVVFGTAGTVIAAMLPLIFTGFGMLRGFALITIIGVLVGIFITRPAYAVIIRHLMKE